MEYLESLNKEWSKGKKLTPEQLRAAYALNMCTVSVSQIVDYHDSYILEQEYDAILNNLNLEQIPKDKNGALLKILVELLNTVTFFKIQDIKKQQIERKYQEQMKNAIWSAIPNLGVIVTGGNPIAIGLSLATQVGAGYMNYRKAKAQSIAAKEDAETELQIVAIEQFNALKRELFTTAWRLADEFGFDDRLRLTERQIEQYNRILLDTDEIRKYARLEAIQDKFLAYPPFWYYFGHTAAYIAEVVAEDEETKKEYREKAKQHFEHYEMMNDFTILREDHLTVSFALEFIDLLLLDGNKPDDNRIRRLLTAAIDNAGNECDLLQLCAVTGLRLEQPELAKRLLKRLVYEDYNKIVNAQLLSCIYAKERDVPEYEMLSHRVAAAYLFPMPPANEKEMDIDKLQERFEEEQRKLLQQKYRKVLGAALSLYAQKLNRRLSVFDLNDEYEEGFFADDERGKSLRRAKATKVLQDEAGKNRYLERFRSIGIPAIYTDTADDMLQKILRADVFKNEVLRKKTVDTAVASIVKNKDKINDCQNKARKNTFSLQEYDKLQDIGIRDLMSDAMDVLYRNVCETINHASGEALLSLDGKLFELCSILDMPVPEIRTGNVEVFRKKADDIPHLSAGLFGAEAFADGKKAESVKKVASCARETLGRLQLSERAALLYRGDTDTDTDFDNYFNRPAFAAYPSLYAHSVAVLQHFNEEFDFIFTTEGIAYLYRGEVKRLVPYEKIGLRRDDLDLDGIRLKSVDVNPKELRDAIAVISGKFIFDRSEKREYIGSRMDWKALYMWFKNVPGASVEGVKGVFARPKQGLLDSLEIHLDQGDWSHCLLQFIYDPKSKLVLEYRIAEFEELDPGLEKKLDEGDGVCKVDFKKKGE